jgi:HlyD family secretion protein
MTMKRIILIAIGAPLLMGALWYYGRDNSAAAPAYRFAEVEQGDIEAAVSATGRLNAVTTVQVGTQVSGQVSAIYVDFNDRVRKGQLIARIDPTLQQQTVRDAEAGLERNRAELEQAQREYDRNKQLHDNKVITDSEFSVVAYRLAVARANVKSAQVTLDRARQNLSYTSIYAPIDGIVVERNVDVGQTVAASLSAPQLFLIANDLSQMQILASIDESDIGTITEGQPVKFTVQAYPNDTFNGFVKQVRLQSTTQENVVNYTAVVSVRNPNGKLLPGMTATAEFVTGAANNVLMVPNAALRFRPPDEVMAEMRARSGGRDSSGAPGTRGRQAGDSARRAFGGASQGQGFAGSAGPRQGGGAGRRGNTSMLWYVGDDGKLAALRVRTALSDGQRTQVSGEGLKPGMKVIIGNAVAGAPAASTSPFQSGSQGGPGGFRPGGF